MDEFYFEKHDKVENLAQSLKYLSPRYIEVKDLVSRLEELKNYEKVVDILLAKKTTKHYDSFAKGVH